MRIERQRESQGRRGVGCWFYGLVFVVFVIVVSQFVLAPLVLQAATSGTGLFAQLLGTATDRPVTGETTKSIADAVAAFAPLVRLFLVFFTGVATVVLGGFAFAARNIFGAKPKDRSLF